MKKIVLLLSILIVTNMYAQNPVEMPLWPDSKPNSNGLDESAQQPTITIYKYPVANSPAIIMCPGGGYAGLAMNHEGHDMASWFNNLGITYIVLKYRIPNGNHEVPLSDAERAMTLVRENAAEWNINPAKVGIMGASAGGHLASTLATHYSSNNTRPDFQILLYPVITMGPVTHAGSRNNLLGSNPPEELIERYSNEKQVTTDTPKAFIVLSSDDQVVPATNGVNYYLTLVNKKISVALFAYPTGGHGWGFHDSFTYKRQWTEELEKWLRKEVKIQ